MHLGPARLLGGPGAGCHSPRDETLSPSKSSLPELDLPSFILTRAPRPGRAPPEPAKERALTVLGESVCPYCGVGCRLRVEGAGGAVTRVRGVEAAAANRGGLCAK